MMKDARKEKRGKKNGEFKRSKQIIIYTRQK